MKIKKFNVYSADLNPKYGTEPGKVRPVIVVQTDMLNEALRSTVICPITTNVVPKASLPTATLSIPVVFSSKAL